MADDTVFTSYDTLYAEIFKQYLAGEYSQACDHDKCDDGYKNCNEKATMGFGWGFHLQRWMWRRSGPMIGSDPG